MNRDQYIRSLPDEFPPFSEDAMRREASWRNTRRMIVRLRELEGRVAAGVALPIERADIADLRRLLAIKEQPS